MTSYTTYTDYASAQPTWLPGELVEENYGSDSAKAGNVKSTPAGWLILDNTYRPATALEASGIDAMMVSMAKALASFAGYDEIEAMAYTLAAYEPIEPLADAEYNAWLDEMADDWADTYASIRSGFSMF